MCDFTMCTFVTNIFTMCIDIISVGTFTFYVINLFIIYIITFYDIAGSTFYAI